jgi:hypothetical protein
MAASNYTIWEMRYNGSDYNSGCFDPNATLATTLSSANGTSTFPSVTSSNYTFSASDVGHYLYVKSGTNWTPGWYQIISAAGSSCVVNATAGQYVGANLDAIGTNGVGSAASLSSGTWTVDYTQSSSARYNYSDINIASHSTSVITSTGSTFTQAHLGNSIRLIGNIAGFTTGIYVISTISAGGTSATLDRAAGTAGTQGCTAYVGGGTTTFRQLHYDLSLTVGGNGSMMVYLKNDGIFYQYGNTNLGGQCTPTFAGYGTYRFDRSKATIYAGEPNTYMFPRGDGLWQRTKDLIFAGNGFTGCRIFSLGNNQSYSMCVNCEFYNLVSNGGAGIAYKKCYFYNVQAPSGYLFENCVFSNCVTTSNNLITNASLYNCLITGCTSNSAFMWWNPTQISSNTSTVSGCIFYNNTLNPIGSYNNFGISTRNCLAIYNNIFANNSASPITGVSDFAFYNIESESNAFYSNGGSGIGTGTNTFSSNKFVIINPVILTETPFVDAASGDFRLNDLPGGGRLCKANGIMTPFYGSTAARNINIGGYQSPVVPAITNMNGGMM